jgi:HSP20 family protein
MSVRKPVRDVQGELAVLHRELNQLVGRLAGGSAGAAVGQWNPPVDVYECRGTVSVVVEVPGIDADSLRVACRNGQLVISGERREQRPPEAASFLCMERPHGRFTRALDVDAALDLSAARARLEEGLLVITLPRLKDRRGRETIIPVERATQ